MTSHPLQNRVQPDGVIVSTDERGLFFGNRGGKIHDPMSKSLLPTRRWASRQWICCVLDFKNRQRTVMGNGYTELFFMDEVTALAAGHRPCFECRRTDALTFARAWRNDGTREPAPHMDRTLHQQRLLPNGSKQVHRRRWQDLPIGAMVLARNIWLAKAPSGPLEWSFDGYAKREAGVAPPIDGDLDCLTPPAILNALANGYEPHWHPSAQML